VDIFLLIQTYLFVSLSHTICMTRVRILALIAFVVIGVVFISGFATAEETPASDESGVLKVFHAGSLTKPFEELKIAFEEKYPGMEVQLVAGGSSKMVKEITDLDKQADVLASADYFLIPNLMYPDYADWFTTFAYNQMVLCYTDESLYADEIKADNDSWYFILARDDVKWAFSDPNLDPCGYRAPIVIQLAESYYGDDQIFENTIAKNSNISTTYDGMVWTIEAQDPQPSGTLTIRPKSVDLVTMLQSGGLDYAWEYRSVADQNDLNYVILPPEIDLSSLDYADLYKTVQINVIGATNVGSPIVYGATVPLNAEDPKAGLDFIALLIGETGQTILTAQGQPPIIPAGGYDKVPTDILDSVALHE